MIDLSTTAPVHAPPASRVWRRRLGVTALFTALTALMTWPQPLVLATHAAQHQDVFFNLWRLRWIHHALTTSPSRLFDGNVFHPERGVLAFSDAILIEGLLALPLFLLGLPPVLVHNLTLLGAIVASGVGMFVLARHLSGSQTAGVVAGIIFAFAPYRFEHYMHMELQWAVWMPWAFWALQRTIETQAWRFGALTGVFIALQMLSSIYYGMFLALLIALVGGVQLLTLKPRQILLALGSLGLGAVIAVTVAGLYSIPYSSAASRVGTRHEHEIRMFSARPRDYRVPTATNLLYGGRFDGSPERRLFPGVLPMLLALAGLLLVRPTAAVLASLLGLLVAFELSLGLNGMLYPILYEHVSAFQGLRAPARVSILGLMFLGVLAAWGCAALGSIVGTRGRRALTVVFAGIVLLEYWVAPLHLVAYHNQPPALYAWLARQPRGVVAEFPVPRVDGLPHEEPRYAYMSTFHWMPLLNGYSGYYPPSYLRRLQILETFPDARSLEQLRADGVRYIVIHAGGYSVEARARVIETLILEFNLAHIGDFDDGWGAATVFAMR
jgi:hypothetical protein